MRLLQLVRHLASQILSCELLLKPTQRVELKPSPLIAVSTDIS